MWTDIGILLDRRGTQLVRPQRNNPIGSRWLELEYHFKLLHFTVEPVYKGHPRGTGNVATVHNTHFS